MIPQEMEDGPVPVSSAEHSFIYLLIYLLSLGWMVEAIFCVKLAGEAALGECRTKVDAGRRSNQQRDLEQDIHMDYTRVFGKWAIKQRAELNAGG